MPLLGLSNFSVVSDEVIFLQLNDVPRDLEGWLMLVYIFLSFLAFFFFFKYGSRGIRCDKGRYGALV